MPAFELRLMYIRTTLHKSAVPSSAANPYTTTGSQRNSPVGIPEVVLSLDFKGSRFLGPPALWRQHSYWPRDLILMTLSQVGMQQGPAWQQLAQLRTRVPNCNIYAAGGVRDRGDLDRLRAMGVAGALLASSLHSGAVDGADLACLLLNPPRSIRPPVADRVHRQRYNVSHCIAGFIGSSRLNARFHCALGAWPLVHMAGTKPASSGHLTYCSQTPRNRS